MTDARREMRRSSSWQCGSKHPEYGLEFETYVSVPGATIDENHAMVQAIERNHRRVIGTPPVRDTVLWCSDASVLSRFGCPTVNYGPPAARAITKARRSRSRRWWISRRSMR